MSQALKTYSKGAPFYNVSYIFDVFLIKARKDVHWNNFVVKVLVQRIQGNKILIQRPIFQLGGQLAKEVKELTVACNYYVVRCGERLELLRDCSPKEFGRLSILAQRDGLFGIRTILIAGLVKALEVLNLTQWPRPSLSHRQPQPSST